MDLGLQGKKAIVCAASKGLGRACAISLAREGVELVITARTAATLEETAAEIRQMTGVKVTAVAGDITSEAGRTAALAACPAPDIVVNNNGGPPRGDFREWDREMWIKAVDANMLAPIFLIKAVIDGMIERKFGRIVNISSMTGQTPNFGQANYAASKGGVMAFTKVVALEMARYNITANVVSPGYTATEMLLSIPTDILDAVKAKIPMGRLGLPEEIAKAVAYLVCDGDYVTGQQIAVNGGMYM
ncbi:MAG: SDR family oxidoreductase [Acidobacteriales bacterium]|nr:SDR family oxidoreductase [Terriglobales bacterium]